MGKGLKDLWILLENGIVLFNRVTDTNIDPQLVGGFMSAMLTYATHMSKDGIGLSSFQVGNKVFYFAHRKQLIFIGNFDAEVKSKKALEELQNVVDTFFDAYSETSLARWGGNVDEFQSFSNKLEVLSRSPVNALKTALW
jgi:hypothetical protein